ncbi:MAG: YggT family protein [Christensenellales bacterium]|jgi:YggT family protein
MSVWQAVFEGVRIFLSVVLWVIIINAILSWFLPLNNKLRLLLDRITSPVIGPFRILSQKLIKGRIPLDLSPLFAILAIRLLDYLLAYVIHLV